MKTTKKIIFGIAITALLFTAVSCGKNVGKDSFNGRWVSDGFSFEFNSKNNSVIYTEDENQVSGTYEISEWDKVLVNITSFTYLGEDMTEEYSGAQDMVMLDKKITPEGNLLVANFSQDRIEFQAETPSKELNGYYSFGDEYEEIAFTFNKEDNTFEYTERLLVDDFYGMYPNLSEDRIIQHFTGTYTTEPATLLSLKLDFDGFEVIQDLDFSFSDDKKILSFAGFDLYKDEQK